MGAELGGSVERPRIPGWLAAAVLALPGPVGADGVTKGIDDEARLPFWQYEDAGASIRLVQRLPDQTRGFFMARGFTAEQAELIAQSCVFQTVFENLSNRSDPDALTYDLKQWQVIRDGQLGSLKTREDWAVQWRELQAPRAAAIAFEWSLFPTVQTYQPGDYNWGMSIFNLPPGTAFDLALSWRQHGLDHHARIEDVRCAPDVHGEVSAP